MNEQEYGRILAGLEASGWRWKGDWLYAPSGSMWLGREPWPDELPFFRERMVGRSLRVRSTLEHEGDDTGGPESLVDVRGLVKVLDTLVGMETDEHALQWEHVRTHYDLRVRAIAERASRERSLRRLCVTGRLRIVSVAPKIELWTGAPGWTRLGIGQDVSGDALRIRVVVKEAASEEPTRVRTNGTWAEGPLVETAEAIH